MDGFKGVETEALIKGDERDFIFEWTIDEF